MKPDLDDLPSEIKKMFEELTMVNNLFELKNLINKIFMINLNVQVEEMLISPILTVMSVFRLPGGHLLSRGHVANFSQDVSKVCSILPRLTSDIPILIVKKIDQNNVSKEFKVNRNRVSTLLKYLCANNPDWKRLNIKYNQENIDKLPENSIPINLNEIDDIHAPNNMDKKIVQTGPSMLIEMYPNRTS